MRGLGGDDGAFGAEAFRFQRFQRPAFRVALERDAAEDVVGLVLKRLQEFLFFLDA